MIKLHAPAIASPGSAVGVLRREGRSFHWAARVLAPPTRLRCARLYAICRQIDDLADLPEKQAARDSADRRLSALVAAIRANDRGDPVVAEAHAVLGDRHGRSESWEALELLVTTARSDLETVRIGTFAELEAYANGVAGTVGVMMAQLLDARCPARALPAARDLGIAMQYTNIARDVMEDAARDRIYLPAEWLADDVNPRGLMAGDSRARASAWAAVEMLLQQAEAAYARGWQGLSLLPVRERLGMAVASRVYRRIGVRIRTRGPGVYWNGRCVVGVGGKLVATVQALPLAFSPLRPT